MICIYHKNCADGFGAAWAVRKKFGSAVKMIPASYQSTPPDVTGETVYIVKDFEQLLLHPSTAGYLISTEVLDL